MDWIAGVQVFHPACTMNVTAVEALKQALRAADDERRSRA